MTQRGNELTTASTFPTIYEGNGTTWDEAASTDISDTGVRQFIKILDDGDVPMMGRAMIIPTIVKQDLMGIDRFTRYDAAGEAAGANTIRNGLVGDAYGVSFYVTTNLPLVEDSAGNADNALGYLLHSDSLVYVEQVSVRSQTQKKLEYLGDLFVSDTLYGVKLLRDDSVVPFVVPTT